MARPLLCLLLALLCCMLSACASFGRSAEDLLRPPRLTEEQKEIEDVLLGSTISSDIILKYPKSGEYRSAFIFQDIDADGEEEALVFYAAASNEYARLSILDKNGNEWEPAYEIGGPQSNVEFIAFEHLTDNKRLDIVVGWSDPSSRKMELGVYSYIDRKLVKRFSKTQLYDTYLIADLDGCGLSEIVLFTRDAATTAQSSWIHLFYYDGSHIRISNEYPLSDSISRYAGVTAGRISPTDSRIGIFIDELRVGRILSTEVYVVENKRLQPIIHASMVTPADLSPWDEEELEARAQEDSEEAPVDAPTLYELTRRSDTTALCADVNGDGIIEIPTGELMPAYETQDSSEWLYLTQYNRLQGNALVEVFSAAVNRAAGYQLKFPASWVGKVTISNQPENNEWRFIEYNEELKNPLENLSGELVRIRVVSRKDYQDKSIEHYTVLGTRGAFTYYGYIPVTGNSPLRITMEQLKSELFSLL